MPSPVLLALGAGGLAISVADLTILVILVAAIVGIGIVAVRASGLAIPSWVINIFWIVLVAVLAILAIKLLLSVA